MLRKKRGIPTIMRGVTMCDTPYLRLSEGSWHTKRVAGWGSNQTGSTADFPSGQRELTVNQSPRASVVRIHYPPRLDSSVVEHFLGKEEVVSPILTRGSHGGIAQLARAYDS